MLNFMRSKTSNVSNETSNQVTEPAKVPEVIKPRYAPQKNSAARRGQ